MGNESANSRVLEEVAMLPLLWKVPTQIQGEGAVPSEPHLSMKLRLLKSRKNLFSFANGFL